MPENKDTPTNVPRTKAGEHATADSPDDKTPPTGPQSGPLSPFGGNPSPALDVYVKGMEDEVHLHPPIDPTPPDPSAPIDQAQKDADAKRKHELEEQAKRDEREKRGEKNEGKR